MIIKAVDSRLYGVWRRHTIKNRDAKIPNPGQVWRFNPDNTANMAYMFDWEWITDTKVYQVQCKNGILHVDDDCLYHYVVTFINDDEICMKDGPVEGFFRRVVRPAKDETKPGAEMAEKVMERKEANSPK